MKHLFSCCIAILFIYSLSAQNNVSISFDQMSHNFGTILEKDGNVAYVFEYKNTGNQDVKIDEINASCGCTTVDWSKEPLAPHKRALIKVIYNPKDRPGDFMRYINIVFSTPYGLEVIPLSISGNVQSIRETWEKTYPYIINELHFNTLKIIQKVYNRDTTIIKLPIYNAASSSRTIQLKENQRYYLPPYNIQKHQQDTLYIRSLSLDTDWGNQRDTFFLQIDSVISSEPIVVNKHITQNIHKQSRIDKLNAPILQTNGEINFGKVKADDLLKQVFFVKNIGINPLFIRKFETSNNLIKIKCKKLIIKENRKSKIILQLNTNSLSTGHYSTKICIISNDLHNQEHIIECKWQIVP